MEFISVWISGAMLALAYATGKTIERRHFLSLRDREEIEDGMVILTYDEVLPHWDVEEAALVVGNVVVSIDYFKRFAGGLKSIVGGGIKSYEPMMDRGRREALLRMKAAAVTMGYQHIINVRLETAALGNVQSGGKGIAGIEVLAYGTALKLKS